MRGVASLRNHKRSPRSHIKAHVYSGLQAKKLLSDHRQELKDNEHKKTDITLTEKELENLDQESLKDQQASVVCSWCAA